eukprot:scaffold15945_cov106-Isochrysis_galbana.AAC.2
MRDGWRERPRDPSLGATPRRSHRDRGPRSILDKRDGVGWCSRGIPPSARLSAVALSMRRRGLGAGTPMMTPAAAVGGRISRMSRAGASERQDGHACPAWAGTRQTQWQSPAHRARWRACRTGRGGASVRDPSRGPT